MARFLRVIAIKSPTKQAGKAGVVAHSDFKFFASDRKSPMLRQDCGRCNWPRNIYPTQQLKYENSALANDFGRHGVKHRPQESPGLVSPPWWRSSIDSC